MVADITRERKTLESNKAVHKTYEASLEAYEHSTKNFLAILQVEINKDIVLFSFSL